MQGLIRVSVWNIASFHKIRQRLLFSTIHKGLLKARRGQHTEKVVLVHHGPDAETTGANLLNGILNPHLRGEYLGGATHDLTHCSSAKIVASAVARQMN